MNNTIVNKSYKAAYIYAGMVIVFWSTISSAFNLALRVLNPIGLLLGASVVSLLVIFIVLLLQKKLNKIMEGSRTDLVRSSLLGFLNPFLYYILLLEAYDRLPAQEAQALNYIWAVMLVILAIPILRQRPNWRDLSGVLISFCGAVVIAIRGKFINMHFAEPVGVFLALISTIVWALFWLYNVKDKRDEVVKLFWIFVFGFIYVLLFFLMTEKAAIPTGEALLWCLYVGVFEMGITFIIWLKALQKSANTARVTNLIFFTPFLSLFFLKNVVKETIAASTLAGLILIIAGILWQQSGRKNHLLGENP